MLIADIFPLAKPNIADPLSLRNSISVAKIYFSSEIQNFPYEYEDANTLVYGCMGFHLG